MMNDEQRPKATVVLAMSADGKIADAWRSPARFGSAMDKSHLETQIAQADGVLFGAATLRAYGTTLTVTNPGLLQQRRQQHKPPQPVHIVCSESGQLNPDYRFFQQHVSRWLLTSLAGAAVWRDRPEFQQVMIAFEASGKVDWQTVFQQLSLTGLNKIVVTGGGMLVASLLAADCIDDLWLTICPLILGGGQAPSPVEGCGFPASIAPRLTLLSAQAIDQEVFLHYSLQRDKN
ncbi:MAG TPA: RibD family protein [Coleofasciculaceae cyanobacterium]